MKTAAEKQTAKSAPMETPVEKRISDLEAQVAALTARVLQLSPRAKDWQGAVGLWADDELSRAIDHSGAEWRKNAAEA